MTASSKPSLGLNVTTCESAPRAEAKSHISSVAAIGTIVLLFGTATLPVESAALTATGAPILIIEATNDDSGSYARNDVVERGIARLKTFGDYSDDWDSNGAVAPKQRSINSALQYITTVQPWHPAPFATLSRNGEPIIEFEDSDIGFFGSIRFLENDEVELYSKYGEEPSSYLVGAAPSERVSKFLLETMKLPTF
jgi:hypothetical protein